MAACRSRIAQHAAALTADEQAQLNRVCKAEGSGDLAQIKAAEKKLCSEIVIDTVPAADRALASSVCAKL